jgi:hypothetical protein
MMSDGDTYAYAYVHRHPERHCTQCGQVLNAVAVQPGIRAPDIGDYTACVRCARVHRIGPGWELIAATREEIGDLLTGPNGDEWLYNLMLIVGNRTPDVMTHPELFN